MYRAKSLIPLLLMKLRIMTHLLQVLNKMDLVLNKYVGLLHYGLR